VIIVFVAVTVLGMLNMFTAVIVEGALAMAKSEVLRCDVRVLTNIYFPPYAEMYLLVTCHALLLPPQIHCGARRGNSRVEPKGVQTNSSLE